jgi:hypothetical protein
MATRVRRAPSHAARRAQGVAQQAGAGQRPDAPRHRGDRGGDLARLAKGDVPDHHGRARFLRACHAVDADIDHDGARLDPIAADEPWAADRGDQDVGLTAMRRQVTGLGMGDRHGAILGQE